MVGDARVKVHRNLLDDVADPVERLDPADDPLVAPVVMSALHLFVFSPPEALNSYSAARMNVQTRSSLTGLISDHLSGCVSAYRPKCPAAQPSHR